MRPAYALIDLSALRHNYRLAKRLTGCNALAVVKANAYGHGALECAAALNEDADGFAVAAIEEALALREAGHRQPIVLLEGWFEAAELELICRHDLWPVVHHHGQLADLREANLSRPLQVWLKLDSGMHRTGFSPVEYPQIWRELQASNKVASLTKITHFARADEPETGRTEEQLETFAQATAGLDGPASLSNSAGVLAWPSAYGDWVRPGIMLYGSSPFDFAQEQAAQLRPVMQLDSRVIAVHNIAAGEPIGYGSRFVTRRASRIGVVAMGYADGYPRHAPDGTPVLVDGQRTCISGRVSMDMLTVDLTGLPGSGLGSHVRLWGDGLDAGEVASHAGTISYQLFCNLNRVPRRYQV
ncbi:alanine racemase [Pseudomonas sp. G11-1]|uniref:Alanine racemase n=1 Tax=Halopseudomonas bauzanensis TaxID=653930 RepID=A0A031MDF5_9GAMM|nr:MULTISPECIES: alanine racemase [Halopseudomonas]MCO5786903.1 alanine racemase [Pseudomonas sp. G11-1]MCO5790129.1 alanine racemase [Pseudomonas sp. G11-2]EZQ18030.1 alanine racemase [Halopseudomonas bauzanensis]TKA92799.1 alanine racemase [Halopseudomonas bauzanensis]WGK61732.1 alanine racemase [Halopseudomonas sp. SMJS2]